MLIYSRSQPALVHSPATYFYKFSGTQPPRFIHLLSKAPFSLQKQSWRTAKYAIGRSRPKIVPLWPFTGKKKKKTNLVTLVPEEQRLWESRNLACLGHYYIPSTYNSTYSRRLVKMCRVKKNKNHLTLKQPTELTSILKIRTEVHKGEITQTHTSIPRTSGLLASWQVLCLFSTVYHTFPISFDNIKC